MLLLVQIDLVDADIEAFDAFEATVQPLMARYGGRIDLNVRALNQSSEIHLVHFPNATAAAAYRADPDRQAAMTLWEKSGARSVVTPVERRD